MIDNLLIILACTTFCYQPLFKEGDCTIDKADKVNPTYRKIIGLGTDDYTIQIANRKQDVKRYLIDTAFVEAFDKNNVKVKCPKWFD